MRNTKRCITKKIVYYFSFINKPTKKGYLSRKDRVKDKGLYQESFYSFLVNYKDNFTVTM